MIFDKNQRLDRRGMIYRSAKVALGLALGSLAWAVTACGRDEIMVEYGPPPQPDEDMNMVAKYGVPPDFGDLPVAEYGPPPSIDEDSHGGGSTGGGEMIVKYGPPSDFDDRPLVEYGAPADFEEEPGS